MHKTGSSSIQNTFNGYDDGRLIYLDLGKPNHSQPLVSALMPDLENYPQVKKKGLSKEEIEDLSKRSKDTLLNALEASRGKDVIISAEYFSQPGVVPRKNLERLKQLLENYFDHVKVIAYVRSPQSFMESALQERVKGGDLKIRMEALYPHYRARFSKFYDFFPESSVSLIEYNQEKFPMKSVVYDFAQRTGLSSGDVKPVRTNEKLGLRALSFLYSYNLFVNISAPEVSFINYSSEFLDSLRFLDDSSFSFSPESLEEILSNHQEDLEWVSRKVTFDSDLQKDTCPPLIDSLSDLVSLTRYDMKNNEEIKKLPGFNDNIKRVGDFENFLDSYAGEASRFYLSSRSLSCLKDAVGRPHVVFRELSRSLLEAGYLEHGRKVAEAGLKLYPGAKGLQKNLSDIIEARNDLPGGNNERDKKA